MVDLSRRSFFGIGAAGAIAAGCATNNVVPTEEPKFKAADTALSFEHGVASGDATSTAAVLWTRVTPAAETTGFEVMCYVTETRSELESLVEAAPDNVMVAGVSSMAKLTTSPASDFTVKVDFGAEEVSALSPATTYYYAFAVMDVDGFKLSPIGQFKTLPVDGTAPFKAAFVSCSNLPFGFFNAYEAIAKRDDVDAVIHLGDYIYEYGRDGYGAEVGAQIGREVEPPHEIVKLDDYRQRYAQYRRDPMLQAAHAACVWYTTWDDHESTNNSYRTGAENHQPETEGEWSVRKAEAVQAYLEWMPVRDPKEGLAVGSIYRSFDIGDLATLFMLEGRLTGRSDELTYASALKLPEEEQMAGIQSILAEASSEERTMLGAVQEEWLAEGLKASTGSGKKWQILGNQVIMARVKAPNVADALPAEEKEAIYANAPYMKPYIEFTRYGLPLNLDAWDGFDAARERLYKTAEETGARLVTITGDTHTAWANELFDKKGARRGVEFGCTSVTSPGFGAMLPMPELNTMMAEKNEEVVYYDAFDHGFTLLTIADDQVSADFIKVSEILKPEYTVANSASFKAVPTDASVSGLIRMEK